MKGMKGKIALAVLVGLVAMGVGAALKMRTVVREIVHPRPEQIKETVEYDKMTGNVNLLVVGEDDVEGSRRSDTVAFVAIDLDGRTVRILSLPRDTRVEIPGHGWQKLNHSFAYGGVDLLRDTVSRLLNMPIHYYTMVDYDSFPALVDLVGGVDLNVEKRMRYVDRAGKLNINIPAGPQHLNGTQALHYVRFRHDALGDIGRVHRQQQFIKALLAKVREPQNLERVGDLAKQISRQVKTDLSTAQAVQLAAFIRDMNRRQILFQLLPGKPAYIGGVSYWLADIPFANRYLTLSADLLLSGDHRARGKDLFAVTSAASDAENEGTSGDLPLSGRGPAGQEARDNAVPSAVSAEPPSLMVRDFNTWVRSFPESVSVLN
jgi:LCP family protein required for cell wall assembly